MTTRQAELEKELFSACKAGDVDRVRRAIAAGVDPKNAIDKDGIFTGETPLHTACMYVIIRRGGWYIDPPPLSPSSHASACYEELFNYSYTYVKTD